MKKIFNPKAKMGLSVICTVAILLAILILINTLASFLPKNVTLLDTSENKMYSLSASAKEEIKKAENNINIYLLTGNDEDSLNDMGAHLNTYLKRLAALNPKISYYIVNLYKNESFLTDRSIDTSTVTLNSIVIESELRYRYIDINDLFYYYIDEVGKVSQQEAQIYQMYYGLTPSYKFGGEGLILRSIDYVSSTELPLAIALTGHGETALSAELKKEFIGIGIDLSELSTLSLVPGCELLIMNTPTSDISSSESSLISKYLNKGGRLLLTTAPGTSDFTNLCSVLNEFGLEYEDGIVIDQTQGSYYQYPYHLIPTANTHDATAGLTASPLLPYSHGIAISDINDIVTTSLLKTGNAAYIIPASSSSIAKPEGQEEKSYTIGAVAENQSNEGTIIWFSSQMMFDENANSVTGGNFKYVSAICKHFCGAELSSTTDYEPITLASEKLTFSFVSMATVALLAAAIIPITVIIIGIIHVAKRKRK